MTAAGRASRSRPDARGRRVAIVAARFNDLIVASLLKGATRVPGERAAARAADLPSCACPAPSSCRWRRASSPAAAASTRSWRSGCVIRGDTPHFDYVAGECARGLQLASLETGVPVIFGVLTVETLEQALERAATATGNKGGEAMETALEMAGVMARL